MQPARPAGHLARVGPSVWGSTPCRQPTASRPNISEATVTRHLPHPAGAHLDVASDRADGRSRSTGGEAERDERRWLRGAGQSRDVRSGPAVGTAYRESSAEGGMVEATGQPHRSFDLPPRSPRTRHATLTRRRAGAQGPPARRASKSPAPPASAHRPDGCCHGHGHVDGPALSVLLGTLLESCARYALVAEDAAWWCDLGAQDTTAVVDEVQFVSSCATGQATSDVEWWAGWRSHPQVGRYLVRHDELTQRLCGSLGQLTGSTGNVSRREMVGLAVELRGYAQQFRELSVIAVGAALDPDVSPAQTGSPVDACVDIR